MKHSKLVPTVVTSIALTTLTACNLEDYLIERLDSVSNEDIAYVASGVITRLDKFTVNGVEFRIDGSQIIVDDQSGSQDQLGVGMYVTVEGSLDANGNTGTASKIIFENEIEGVVEANNMASDGTLKIMGQTVIVDTNTRFESELVEVNNASEIPLNSFVEISGFSSRNGDIHATRIEVKSDTYKIDAEFEIKGTVTALTETSFFIGEMEIDYAGAGFEDFSNAPLKEGMYVEVKTTTLPEDGLLVASKIELEDVSHKSQHSAEIEGIVSESATDTSFVLNGHTIYIDGNTAFEHGDKSDLVTGQKVEVEGSYDHEARFLANQVDFKRENDDSDHDEHEEDHDDEDGDLS